MSKLIYAYQHEKKRQFVGVFPGGEKELELSFVPVEGRDKVRNNFGELEEYADECQLEHWNNSEWYDQFLERTVVQESAMTLVVQDLNYENQIDVVLPDAFDSFALYLSGANTLGLEISLALMKMGVQNLSVYDPGKVSVPDIALGSFRVFDPTRMRVSALKEIVMDQTRKRVNAFSDRINSVFPLEPDGINRIVINTSDNREEAWKLMKGRPELFIDVQVTGERGVIYCVNPLDRESVVAYEESLSLRSGSSVIYMTKVLAGAVAHIVKRYALSIPTERFHGLRNFYCVDLNVLL